MDHELKDRERFITSWYMVNKFVDLVETVFFVLRKRNRQISFLHVFHHFSMALSGYLYYYFFGYGGIAFPLCFLNVAVHVVMYTYYYLSSISLEVQQSLWWKKYITLVQLAQFALIMSLCMYTLTDRNCSANKPLTIGCGLLAASFTVLFCQFYFNTYIRTGKKKSKQDSH
ncbi:very long chain fatty acid elongase F isoform X2 [Drosophila takahashii]|nr:elongation of very long chain fatty acids protein F isoform X2 [Drosophila takahashii]